MNKHKARRALKGPKNLLARQRRALQGEFVPEDLHNYRVDRHTFTIWVAGDPDHPGPEHAMELGEPGVEYMMADRFEINLNLLTAIDPTRPILINMASCGGYWDEGMKMFDAILTCPNPITILATKWARSMTSIIPLAADRFLMRPSVQYMFHLGDFEFSGLAQQLMTDAKELFKTNERMLRLYAARLREQGIHREKTEDGIKRFLMREIERDVDVWLSARDAVNWGFADGVYLGDEQNLRAPERNEARRARMLKALTSPIRVTVTTS